MKNNLLGSSNGKQAHVWCCSLPFTVQQLEICNINVCSKTPQGHCQNLFINLPLKKFCPLSLSSISNYSPRFPEYRVLSCIPRHYEEAKVKFVNNWLSIGDEFRLTVRKRQLRLQRLSRGFSSREAVSGWCVAAVAVQVSVSGCSVKCDTPWSWSKAGKIGEAGGPWGLE